MSKPINIPQRVTGKCMRDIYMNREYSWLLFNKRVLDQAEDLTNPLLERCKFLSIFTSNLDEFFMVRVGSLVNENITEPNETENKTKLTAAQQLDAIADVVKRQYRMRAECFRKLRKELSGNGVKLLRAAELTPRQEMECRELFMRRVLPLLSLMVLDAKHPLMQFENKRGYVICQLEKEGRRMIGVVSINPALEKLYRIGEGKKVRLIVLEELVRLCAKYAFTGYTVSEQLMVRVTRNADFDTALEDTDLERDFTEVMKRKVESRARMGVVRLEVDNKGSKLKDFVLRILKLDSKFCFEDESYFDYKFLFSLGNYFSAEAAAKLKYEPFKGAIPSCVTSAPSLIELISSRDVFLSYPYDSMSPVVDLLEECSRDKRVSSIMITIYRLAHHSRIAELLCRASENGKQVTVVIELCARFDEENNLYFANKLQEAGCTIIYGMDNYKVHSKIISIVLQDGGEISYITHLGTGNYNESTSRQYTDLNILTSDNKIGEDAVAFFRNVAICNTDFKYQRLLVAPETLKSGLLACIDREIEKAKAGKEGRILAKMNSLTDKEIIDRFAAASEAGVKIELVIRGICCLVPGIEGRTDNIRVVSIVGRFLEHSRVYCFGGGKDRVMYISSADLMTRNTDKRVEIATPVLDEKIADEIEDIVRTMLADNVKARELHADGTYSPVPAEGDALNAQESFLREASRSRAFEE